MQTAFVIVAEACAVPAAAYCKGERGIRCGGWVEVVGQIGERAEEGGVKRSVDTFMDSN